MITDWRERLQAHARRQAFVPQCDRFYFLRHGQTDHNRRRICQGQTDVPLNDTGLAQAKAAATVIAVRDPVAIRASDLMRVRQTAAPVADRLGLDIAVDRRLRERGFGVFENQRINGQLWSFVHPSMETIEQFVDRSLEGLAAALTRDDVLVVTHGGLRRVLAGALGLDLAEWTAHNALPLHVTRHGDGWRATALTAAGSWPADGPPPSDLDR